MSRASGAFALVALGCGVTCTLLAANHPLVPSLLVLVGLAVAMAESRSPGLFLVLLPACLPWFNWAPWTGWIMVDEFDLLVLAVLAGGYARCAVDARQNARPLDDSRWAGWMPPMPWTAWAWSLVAVFSLARGLMELGTGTWSNFADYVDWPNSLRSIKGLVWCWLALPLLWRACREDLDLAWARLQLGMCVGLAILGATVLWERAAYPGLLDFKAAYRATGTFWEMHVGGSAIDAYLALALPFAFLGIARAPQILTRVVAAVAWALGLYAVVATVSRLAFAGAAVGMVVAWLLGRPRPAGGWTARTLRTLAAALPLIAAAGGLLWVSNDPETFLGHRLRATEQVWEKRLDHWRSSVDMLRSPAEHWLGIGLGRFPDRYSTDVEGGGRSGAARAFSGDDGGATPFVMLRGPSDSPEKAGLFGLTQRLPVAADARYVLSGSYRATGAAELLLRVCERHLLYDVNCQSAVVDLEGEDIDWRGFSVALEGDRFDAKPSWVERSAVLSMSVLTVDEQVDLTGLVLAHDGTGGVLVNGDFSQGLARWFPSAQYYFRPWHADSLWLELLIERGVVGVLACAMLLVQVGACVWGVRRGSFQIPACLVGGLTGVLVVGVGASLLDAPRIAFLVQFLWLFPIVASRARIEPGQGGGLLRPVGLVNV